MTDYNYDDFDDAADCILGAAKDLAASEAAFEDEIPVAQEVEDDNRSYVSTKTEGSDLPGTRRMPNVADALYNNVDPLINPLDGTGLFCEKCGGTFAKVTSKSTKQKAQRGALTMVGFRCWRTQRRTGPKCHFFLLEWMAK